MLTYYAAYTGFILLFSTFPSGESNGFDLTQGLVVGSIFFVFIVGFMFGDSVESAERHEKEKNLKIDELRKQIEQLKGKQDNLDKR